MGMDHNGAIDACECEDCQRRRGWLDELERLEREATPFPWEPVPGHGVIESPTHVVESGYRSEVNVRLIAALRNHARDLIEAARRCEELEEAVRSLARLWPAERWATLSGICRDHPLIDEIANLKKGGA
jgi:hypothetical protein